MATEFNGEPLELKAKNLWRCILMAYVITDACIGCGACAEDCPVNAISEKDGKYEINKDECIDCGACAASCPVEAPVAE